MEIQSFLCNSIYVSLSDISDLKACLYGHIRYTESQLDNIELKFAVTCLVNITIVVKSATVFPISAPLKEWVSWEAARESLIREAVSIVMNTEHLYTVCHN